MAAAQWGWLAGSLLNGIVGGPRKGRPTIHESGVQTIQEGAPIPIVFGTAPVTGNVIAAGPMRKVETPIKQSKGGSKTVGTDVQYFCTYAIELCKGPLPTVGVPFIVAKRDGKIVFDARPGSGFDADNAAFLAKCAIYYGTEDQMPDPSLEAIFGAGEVSAHRGIPYIVFKDHDQTDRGGSLSQWEFVIGNGFVPIYSNLESRIISLVVAESYLGVQKMAEADPSNTTAPTWESYFSEFGESAIVQFTSFPYFTSDNVDIDSLSPALENEVPIELETTYRLLCYAMMWRENKADVSIEFLNGSGGVVAVLQVVKDGDYVSSIYGGTSWGTATLKTGGPARTDTTLSFTATHIVATDNGEVGVTTGSFSIACAASTIASLRVVDCLVRSESFGLFPGDAASYVVLHKEATEEEPPPEIPEGTVRLSDVVSQMHSLCDADAPVVTDLQDIVMKGLVLASPGYTAADVIDMLRELHMFDRVEKDGATHYELRGKPVVATITEDDLVDEDEESQREAPLMFPRKLLLTCINPNANYETATPPPSTRYSPDVRVQGEQSVSYPVVMDEEEASVKASILHKVAWAEAEGEIRFSLPLRWIWLTPGDCVILAARGQSRRVRIDEIEESDFVLKITGRVDRASAYTANPVFIPLVPPEPPVSAVPGQTTLAVLDIPAIVEQDDALVMRLAVVGGATGWRGAVVQRSLDSGESFSDVASLGAATFGVIQEDVPEASEHYTDTTNQVRVQLLRTGQELNPISDAGFLGSGGTFALEKADGTFELMQYRDAEDEGDGVFVLSTLHRGLLNSKSAAHSVGAKFVLLSDTVAVPAQSTWLGLDLVHRAPSVGTTPEEASQQTATFVGRSQLEWSVYLLSLERDVDTITASWLPRHRFGSDVNPLASVNFQGYRVTFDDGTTTESLDVTEPAFTFDASGMDAPLTVTVAALNRITGPGEAITEEI